MRRAYDFAPRTEFTGSGSLKIGEVSKRSGIGIEALRFYEKSGLLDRPGRTYSGYRVYNESVLTRLAFIKKAQSLGFSLDRVRQLIKHKKAGENPCEEVREVVREKLSEMDMRIEQMLAYREELSAALDEWEEKGDADGHICGLIESSHIEREMNRSFFGG